MLRDFRRVCPLVCPALLACLTVALCGCGNGLSPVSRDDFDQSVSSGAAAQSWPLLFYKVCDGEKSLVLALGIARSWESLTPLEQRRQQEDAIPSYLANLIPVEKRLPNPNEFSSPPYIIYTYNALEEEEHEFVRRNQALYEAYTRGETLNFWWGVASVEYFVQTRQNGKPVFFVSHR